jgi:hypothetical protein
VWESTINNQQLSFHLAGINNQNFIMRDQETGSWWQQISGEAIQGRLKGTKLKPVYYDELTFAVWKRENPNGRVLRPDPKILAAGKYESADWEQDVGKLPVNVSNKLDDVLEPRKLIVGIKINDEAKAYPMSALEKQSPIIDKLGDKEIVVILGEDKKSVRAFERTVDNRKLEFFIEPKSTEFQMIDAETGSSWDFTGKATSGELAGKQLTKVTILKDYWFDWKTYNPATKIYNLGEQ